MIKANYKSHAQSEKRMSFGFVKDYYFTSDKMVRLTILTICLILVVASNFVACSSDEIEVSIVPDMTKYLMENPYVKMQPLAKHRNGASPYGGIKYTLGKRVAGKALIILQPMNNYIKHHIFTIFGYQVIV